jgi:hypothetical protein
MSDAHSEVGHDSIRASKVTNTSNEIVKTALAPHIFFLIWFSFLHVDLNECATMQNATYYLYTGTSNRLVVCVCVFQCLWSDVYACDISINVSMVFLKSYQCMALLTRKEFCKCRIFFYKGMTCGEGKLSGR